MVSKKIEIGRVATIHNGQDYGKLVVIVDVIEQNLVLVDAPDMVRGEMDVGRLLLTHIKIDIKKSPEKKDLIDAMLKAADVRSNLRDLVSASRLLGAVKDGASTSAEQPSPDNEVVPKQRYMYKAVEVPPHLVAIACKPIIIRSK